MGELLFNIEAKPVNYTVEVLSYKYNKVFNKLLSELKKDLTLIIEEKSKPGSEVNTFTVTTDYKGTLSEFIDELRHKLAKIAANIFPDNYAFDFRGNMFNLGYTYSFVIKPGGGEKNQMFFHRITEKRYDGTTKPAQRVILV